MFVIPEGGLTLLKAVFTVCLDLNVAAAFRTNTCIWDISESHATKSSRRECVLKCLILTNIWVGEVPNAKASTLPGTFLWLFELSLPPLPSAACVYMHANTLVVYLTGLDISPLTYVWSFCKHVSTEKYSTCIHDTHTNTNVCLFVHLGFSDILKIFRDLDFGVYVWTHRLFGICSFFVCLFCLC